MRLLSSIIGGAVFNWQQGLSIPSRDILFNAFYRNIKISENRVGIIILGIGCLIQGTDK